MVAGLLLVLLFAPWLAPLMLAPVTVAPPPPRVHVAKVSMDGPAYEDGNVEPKGEMPDGVSRRVFPKCVSTYPHVSQAPDASSSTLDLGSGERQRQTIVSHGSRAPPAS
jgi:hypothetical protein